MNQSDTAHNSKLGLSELIAMGVGGMIGGGIFSVMGLAAGIAGHATPIAFALGGLELIAAFSSITFLLVSTAVSVANYRLRNRTGARVEIIVVGIALMLATIVVMIIYLWQQARSDLIWIGSIYATIVIMVLALPQLRRKRSSRISHENSE